MASRISMLLKTNNPLLITKRNLFFKNPAVPWAYRWQVKPVNDNRTVFTLWARRVAWAFMFWSFWNDPDLLLGHVQPDPESWTDEELGIPPDDVDL